jgi:hypothetical protein
MVSPRAAEGSSATDASLPWAQDSSGSLERVAVDRIEDELDGICR